MNAKGLKVSMVCLNPALGFKFLKNQVPRSLILTSGTLSPLKSFESELMIDFQVRLDNGHVIDTKKQVKPI